MKRFIFIVFTGIFSLPIFSQDNLENDTIALDSLYREDQFYIGITYNLLSSMPSGVSQNGFSSGFQIGFIRDMPISKNRKFALGLGIGYSANSFNQNIFISNNENSGYSYTIVDNSFFTKNKFFQHILEVPFEIRFRNSTPQEHKFFRLHAGFKIGYLLGNSSRFKGESGNLTLRQIEDFNDLQYALTFNIGYNTFNVYIQYGLNPIFNSNAKIEGNSIDMRATKIGLIFFIL